MAYSFSKRSEAKLETCEQPLIELAYEMIKIVDFTVLCGFRDKEKQEEAFRLNHTTKRWPYSKHNKLPSPAMDLAPYPIKWDELDRFAYFAGWVMSKAKEMGILIRWGGDWDGDFHIQDHRLIDMPHFELIEVNNNQGGK